MKENKTVVKYPANRELGKQLKKGDRVEIARLSEFSEKYVRDVFLGYRHNDDIVAWGKRIINDRQIRLEQIENPTLKSNKY